MRKRRRRKSEMRADIANAQSLFTGLYKKPENRKAGVMAKGGQRPGGGAIGAHAQNITNKLVLSSHF